MSTRNCLAQARTTLKQALGEREGQGGKGKEGKRGKEREIAYLLLAAFA